MPPDSNRDTAAPSVLWASLVRMVLWGLLYFALFEGVVAWRYSNPEKEPVQAAGGLLLYFEHGRSVEGKLRRMIQATREKSHPLVEAAWLGAPAREDQLVTGGRTEAERRGKDGEIAVFGMSFANHILEAFVRENDGYRLSSWGGPAAPPNFVYAVFETNFEESTADVYVLAFLSSTVPNMLSMSGQTTSFERPPPFTYPIYRNEGGVLRRVEPLLRDEASLRSAFEGWASGESPAAWEAWREQLAANDAYYSSFLFRRGFWDELASVRMARRAWARTVSTEASEQVYDGKKFTGYVADTLPLMTQSFARRVRERGKLPIVILVHDLGWNGTLRTLLAPTLEREQIPTLSTDDVVSPKDPLQFADDGHIRPEGNARLGVAFGELLRRSRAH